MKFTYVIALLFCATLLIQCNKTPDLKFSKIEYLDGDQVKTIEVGNGKKSVVHFYASWCGDCIREIPDANEVLSGAPDDVRVYYLTDDRPELKAKMEKRFNIPFPTYQVNKSLKHVGITYLPLTYFIDENGQQVIAQAEQIDWHSEEIKTFLGY